MARPHVFYALFLYVLFARIIAPTCGDDLWTQNLVYILV